MNDIFPKRLKQLRLEKGMTQEEIAEQLNTRRSTYGEYERGKIMPPIDKVESVAKILETTPQYLLGWDEQQTGLNMTGEIVRRIREKKHISAEEFASDVGIHVSDLRKYENNTEPIPEKMLQVFADYLKVPVEALRGTTVGFSNAGGFYIAKNPNILKTNARWYSIFGDLEFTIEEHDKLMEFAKFLLYQRGENNK